MRDVMRTRWRSVCWSAACRTENNPREPGSAGAMDRSSPKILCQRVTVNRLFGGSSHERTSRSRSRRCGGRCNVRVFASMSQPRTRFCGDHHTSPFCIFFVDAGSFRCGESAGERGAVLRQSPTVPRALPFDAVASSELLVQNRPHKHPLCIQVADRARAKSWQGRPQRCANIHRHLQGVCRPQPLAGELAAGTAPAVTAADLPCHTLFPSVL